MSKVGLILLLLPFLGFSQKQFDVFFDSNKDYPNEVSLSKLNKWITENKSVEVTQFLGFCDSVDDNKYNKDLAMRRINSVIMLLNENAVSINQNMQVKVVGEDFKQSSNQEENRKVTFSYFEKTIPTTEDEKEETELDFSVIVKNEKENLAEKFKQTNKTETIRLNSIRFHLDTSNIIELSKPVLEELVQILKDNPNLKIEIQGHICCQFFYDVSGLSTARAKAIYAYLVEHKIERRRLKYKGYGTLNPIHKIPEQNAIEEQENRRVEILIVDK